MSPKVSVQYRAFLTAWLVLAATGLSGCARMVATPFIRQTPMIDRGRFQSSFNMLYRDPAIDAVSGKTLLVRVADPCRTLYPEYSKVSSRVNWAVWWPDFENHLANVLWQSRVFSDVSATSDVRPLAQPDLTLEVALVRWDEGWGWPRFVLGFGVGATRVQWEGRLTENASDRLLLAFADARLHPGGPSLTGPNFRALKGDVLIGEDLHAGCRELADILRKATRTTEKPYSPYRRHPTYRRPAEPEAPALHDDAMTTQGFAGLDYD